MSFTTATPPVKVHPVTLGLSAGAEPLEWFACCTEARHTVVDGQIVYTNCNWYGGYRADQQAARSDAARHRRSHVARYTPPTAEQWERHYQQQREAGR